MSLSHCFLLSAVVISAMFGLKHDVLIKSSVSTSMLLSLEISLFQSGLPLNAVFSPADSPAILCVPDGDWVMFSAL